MKFLKKTYGLIFGIIFCAILFYFSNTTQFFGKWINHFHPCTQDPTNSFPCFGFYDMGMMILAVGAGIILTIILIVKIIRFKKISK